VFAHLTFAFDYDILIGKVRKIMKIKIYKLKGKRETFLKEYKTMKGALDYIEDIKNYDYMLLGIKGKQVVIYQGQQQKKNFFEKLLDLITF
jgi:hypothetical protein